MKPRVGCKYIFIPNLFDRTDVTLMEILKPGTLVKVIKSPMGTPPSGTMGMTYVGDKDTGKFIHLVCCNSLVSLNEYNHNPRWQFVLREMQEKYA